MIKHFNAIYIGTLGILHQMNRGKMEIDSTNTLLEFLHFPLQHTSSFQILAGVK
jgi:hypothetical protein